MSGEQCSVACAQENSEKLTGDRDTGELASPVRPQGWILHMRKKLAKFSIKIGFYRGNLANKRGMFGIIIFYFGSIRDFVGQVSPPNKLPYPSPNIPSC